jgi:hypothetical protein
MVEERLAIVIIVHIVLLDMKQVVEEHLVKEQVLLRALIIDTELEEAAVAGMAVVPRLAIMIMIVLIENKMQAAADIIALTYTKMNTI